MRIAKVVGGIVGVVVIVGLGGLGFLRLWVNYSHMSEEEMGPMYDFLRTVKPVTNKIASVFPDAT